MIVGVDVGVVGGDLSGLSSHFISSSESVTASAGPSEITCKIPFSIINNCLYVQESWEDAYFAIPFSGRWFMQESEEQVPIKTDLVNSGFCLSFPCTPSIFPDGKR